MNRLLRESRGSNGGKAESVGKEERDDRGEEKEAGWRARASFRGDFGEL